MKNQNNTKLFAFKLAEKSQVATKKAQWKARNNVATAGCTGMFTRADNWQTGEADAGIYC